ncbi:MAG: UpxY family transcription antiterminator [bacterium]
MSVYDRIGEHELQLTATQNWYALYTRSRFEKIVAEELEDRGVAHFLPLVPKLRHWKDRKKMVKMPIFPGYVFVRIDLAERIKVLRARGAVRLVGFNGKPSPIPEEQIESVRRLLRYPDRVEVAPYFVAGDPVEITAGPLSGLSGRIIENRGKTRFLVGIDIIQQAISIEVDAAWLKPAMTSTDIPKRSTDGRFRTPRESTSS